MVPRRLASLGVVAFLALTFLAPLAPAQQGGPVFTLQLEPSGGTITKVDGKVTLRLNVTVKSSQQNEFAREFDVIVTLNRTAPLQNGWAVSEVEPRQKTVKPGDRFEATLVVQTTIADPQEDEIRITYRAHSRPVFKGQSNPLTDALLRQMSQEDDETASAVVKRELDVYERITGLTKAQPWLFIVLAGGLFVLGVVLVRRKKGGVTVASDAPVQQVLPGRGASFPVKVRNEGHGKQTLTLGASEVPEGWSAILPVERIELEGNESTTIWLTLRAPANAHPGEHVQLNFIATGGDGASAEALLEAAVVPSPGGAQPEEPEPVAARAPRRRR